MNGVNKKFQKLYLAPGTLHCNATKDLGTKWGLAQSTSTYQEKSLLLNSSFRTQKAVAEMCVVNKISL